MMLGLLRRLCFAFWLILSDDSLQMQEDISGNSICHGQHVLYFRCQAHALVITL